MKAVAILSQDAELNAISDEMLALAKHMQSERERLWHQVHVILQGRGLVPVGSTWKDYNSQFDHDAGVFLLGELKDGKVESDIKEVLQRMFKAAKQ